MAGMLAGKTLGARERLRRCVRGKRSGGVKRVESSDGPAHRSNTESQRFCLPGKGHDALAKTPFRIARCRKRRARSVHPAGAFGLCAGSGSLELSLSLCRQCRCSGVVGGKHGGAQALRTDSLCAERLQEAADEAGLPSGVFQTLHASHSLVAKMVADERVDFVAFTGSVEGAARFIKQQEDTSRPLVWSLAGRTRPMSEPMQTPNGQERMWRRGLSSIRPELLWVERVYVHEAVYDDVVAAMVEEAQKLVLGNPLDPHVSLGPMVRGSSADRVRNQMNWRWPWALSHWWILPSLTPRGPGPYLAPQILGNVTHDMEVMVQESFGPVVGVMKVGRMRKPFWLMNDSRYGLTASIWTKDLEVGMQLANRVETGTVFLNRCDFLDPELAWVGVKDSGRGCTLSSLGFSHMTRPKSFHFRTHP